MELPRILIIAGTGRESGKTTLACKIIRNFCSLRPIVAVKISPHMHRIEPGGQILFRSESSCIVEETNTGTGKDSSRMLAAGAQRSFFVVAAEDQLPESIRMITGLCGEEAFLVCESGGLRRWIEPGLFLMVSRVGQKDKKPPALDLVACEYIPISFDGDQFSFDLNRIAIDDDRWKTE